MKAESTTSDQHRIFMQRALDIAKLGMGTTAPNPMVGCVIVKNGSVIGEGWHKQHGGPHAEVNAVADVGNDAAVEGSTVYVSLEPCAHFGKTPPCADLLVRLKPAQVVICNTDPNPLVSGGGISKLKAAGIHVTTGVLEAQGRMLNRRFFTYMEAQRPYVILKWAETADRFVARANYDSKWISNPHSRKLVHKWRSEEQAIMVGYNTALHDDPYLTTRDWSGKNPIRVVLDPHGKLPDHINIFNNEAPTLRLTKSKTDASHSMVLDDLTPASILNALYQQKFISVIVEGGAATLAKFIDAGLWDEARVFTSPQHFGTGISAPHLPVAATHISDIFGDSLHYYFNRTWQKP